jgi:paraquat-inducible protein A
MRLIACRECDALIKVTSRDLATLVCPRCGCVVHRAVSGRLDTALAFYLAAGVFLAIANVTPVVSIEAAGSKVDTTLLGAALALHAQQMTLVALIVVLTTIVVPTLDVVFAIALLSFAKSRRSSRTLARCLRVRAGLRPWSMIEIFVLGALVAIVKLGGLASVVVGTGICALAAFMVISAAASHAFDPSSLWNDVEASA